MYDPKFSYLIRREKKKEKGKNIYINKKALEHGWIYCGLFWEYIGESCTYLPSTNAHVDKVVRLLNV